MKKLVIDVANFIHRSNVGFLSEYSIVFNFFRSLKALTVQMKPDMIIFVREGTPQARLEMSQEYKGNRKIKEDDPEYDTKVAAKLLFMNQAKMIYSLLEFFPCHVVKHPNHEADDIIGLLAKSTKEPDECVIVSNDSDFIQLLSADNPVIQIYNPMKKAFVDPPTDYDYLVFKSMKGDSSDNIKGIPGVGAVKAEKLARICKESYDQFIEQVDKISPDALSIFERNFDMIRLPNVDEIDQTALTIQKGTQGWDTLKSQFETMNFQSILREWSMWYRPFLSLQVLK